ncbi:chromosome-associated kinesin KIF4A isoform X2 [Phyllopteryx taeniolatus]|uniref:chromosome-associated kinesin KIF4A isoform X2 n=1 Tax=Phyllopteryx taeniolatus TaxID=161469 RepID=UPI002AD5AEDA|nr:chromosome-associated kinesin KIF4A isoform X2 [Phyllopteryx taeniolatus]
MENISTLIDDVIIKQVLTNAFSGVMSPVKEELFIAVSYLQVCLCDAITRQRIVNTHTHTHIYIYILKFHPDGSTVDLLNPDTQTLELIPHPVLGGVIRGLGESCVDSAEEAYTLYKTCREAQRAKEDFISTRCSWLFTVAVERKVHEGKMSLQLCRSKLRVFSLVGAANETDLMGVNPLLKVMDQIPSEATKTDPLLHFLLSDALTGNSRTALIYCIQPQDGLDDETRSALAVAQKVKRFLTRASVCCWSPEKTQQEIRGRIMELRHVMMSDASNGTYNIHRLAELIQSLQIVKEQSWEKKREESERIKFKFRVPQKGQTDGHLSAGHSIDATRGSDTVECLQTELRQEMEAHVREDGGSTDKVQERVTRILQLREALREETMKNISAEKCDLCLQLNEEYQLEDCHAHERRRQLKELSGRLIQQEMEKMERDLAREQLPSEGVRRELLVMSRERQVLVLQMEALREEAQQAHKDLQEQRHNHQSELRRLREESLQVFRSFHESSEDLRRVSEARYRSVLLEAVHDAVNQSAQNQQLQADNKQLRKGVCIYTCITERSLYALLMFCFTALGELKDTLTKQGVHKASVSPPKLV